MNIPPLLENLLGITDDLIWIFKEKGPNDDRETIIWCNQTIERLTGYSGQEFKQAGATLLCGPETDWHQIRKAKTLMDDGLPVRFHVTQYRKDGTTYWADTIVRPYTDPATNIRHFISIQRDITQLMRQQNRAQRSDAENRLLKLKIERSNSRLNEILETIGDGVIIYDADDKINFFNKALCHLLGPAAEHLYPGMSYREFYELGIEYALFDTGDLTKEEWIAEQKRQRQDPSSAGNISVSHNGKFIKRHDTLMPNGEYIGLRVDVTDLVLQKKELQEVTKELREVRAAEDYQHTHDSLTGLPNHAGMERHLAELAMKLTPEDRVVALQFSITNLRKIKGIVGHRQCQSVIVNVAQALCAQIGDTIFCSRITNSEFILLWISQENDEQVYDLADSLVRSFQRPFEVDGRKFRIHANIGVAIQPERKFDPEVILQEAELALERSCESDSNQIEFFSDTLDLEIAHKIRTADEIVEAIETSQFIPFFQPQFSVRDQRLVGLEALVRWQHPNGQVLVPGQFLHIANDIGVTHEIDSLILKKSLEILEQFQHKGIFIPKLSVNVSFAQLLQFRNHLAANLKGNYAGELAFELVETIFLDDAVDDFSSVISEMRAQKISIELDDFGTGHSSLLSLMKLLPDTVKIDRQLLKPVDTSAYAYRTLRSVVEMCHATGASVTAEGVETKEQFKAIREIGVDTAQGFLLAKPMPADKLLTFVKDHSRRSVA